MKLVSWDASTIVVYNIIVFLAFITTGDPNFLYCFLLNILLLIIQIIKNRKKW